VWRWITSDFFTGYLIDLWDGEGGIDVAGLIEVVSISERLTTKSLTYVEMTHASTWIFGGPEYYSRRKVLIAFELWFRAVFTFARNIVPYGRNKSVRQFWCTVFQYCLLFLCNPLPEAIQNWIAVMDNKPDFWFRNKVTTDDVILLVNTYIDAEYRFDQSFWTRGRANGSV
jgi:hypothetical protein